MKLYLVRHGEAFSSLFDPQRPLNEEGLRQVIHLAEKLQEEDAHPQQIYHSGILRAQQTADLLAQSLQVTQVEKLADLLPEDTIDSVLHKITTWTQDTLLVGHLPYLSYLLSALSDEGDFVIFNTATAVILEKTGEKWWIQAVLSP